MEAVIFIATGRLHVRTPRHGSGGKKGSLHPTIHGAELHNAVREIFQIPL